MNITSLPEKLFCLLKKSTEIPKFFISFYQFFPSSFLVVNYEGMNLNQQKLTRNAKNSGKYDGKCTVLVPAQ